LKARVIDYNAPANVGVAWRKSGQSQSIVCTSRLYED